MRLADPNAVLTLQVLAYEFPALHHDPYDYDANWLRVRLALTTPDRHLEVTGPYLLTWELEALADALEDARADPPVFVEPNLRVDRYGSQPAHLRVRLRGEIEAMAMQVDLAADAASCRRAARALRDELLAWPRRFLRGA